MSFTFEKTSLPGILVITPQVFGDTRGYFMETYKKELFTEAVIGKEFFQDNESSSTKGVDVGFISRRIIHKGSLCVLPEEKYTTWLWM